MTLCIDIGQKQGQKSRGIFNKFSVSWFGSEEQGQNDILGCEIVIIAAKCLMAVSCSLPAGPRRLTCLISYPS